MMKMEQEYSTHKSNTHEAVGEGFGVAVVVGEARHVVLKREGAGRREQTGLAHAAAQGLAQTPRLRPAHQSSVTSH